MAADAGTSRLYAGVEFASDVSAGTRLGSLVADQVIARAKGDGSDAAFTGSFAPAPGNDTLETALPDTLIATWQNPVDPNDKVTPVPRAPLLVRSKGAEVGVSAPSHVKLTELVLKIERGELKPSPSHLGG